MIGIYKITSPSGRIYIGQSTNIQRRWERAYKKLKCKGQPRLYASIVKYGFSEHIFEVKEKCTVEELNVRERHWQDFYDVLGSKGLNCKLQSTSEQKATYSQDSRDRNAASQRAFNLTPEGKKIRAEQVLNFKAFLLTPEGREMRANKVANQIAFNQTEKGAKSKAKRLKTRKAFDQTEEGRASRARSIANRDEKAKAAKTDYTAIAKKKWVPIFQYEKDNTFIREWSSTKEASKTLKISRQSISHCLTKRSHSAGGFIWEYKNK
jgi:group I intron endonuclease